MTDAVSPDVGGRVENPPPKGFDLMRVVAGFWLLGLCNNYIYVIMLSAAHDIIEGIEHQENGTSSSTGFAEGDAGRNCTNLTVGAILLADIIPTLAVKLVSSFLPFFVHIRILLAVTTGIISLVLVATSKSVLVALIGVCFASFNSGLGEVTLLAYSSNFVLHAVSGWSSGTGGAGLAGSFAYAGMTEASISPSNALLISISVPLVMAVSFWVVLKQPEGYKGLCANKSSEHSENADLRGVWERFVEKVTYVPKLVRFMLPLGLVYYFEYLINSGLFDKIEFENTRLSKSSQFRWFNAMYQVGVFASRSSVTWIHFERIWIMAVLQGVNLVVFLLETLYGFVPNIWCMFILIFWEGLLGGAAYVNTFYNMSIEVEKEKRLFALGIASLADTLGIVLSGVTTFPLHRFVCSMPYEPIFRWPIA